MLRRRGRHRLNPQVRSHRGIVWCRIQLPRPHRRTPHQADGFSGHLNSKEQLDFQYLSNSSSSSLIRGQMLNNSIVGRTTTIFSIAGVPHTLPRIVPNPRNLFRVKTPTRTPTRTKAKSRWCKINKDWSILLPSLNSRRTHQLWRVLFLSIPNL